MEESCTTSDVQNPVKNGINYQPQVVQDCFHQQYLFTPSWWVIATHLKNMRKSQGSG